MLALVMLILTKDLLDVSFISLIHVLIFVLLFNFWVNWCKISPFINTKLFNGSLDISKPLLYKDYSIHVYYSTERFHILWLGFMSWQQAFDHQILHFSQIFSHLLKVQKIIY